MEVDTSDPGRSERVKQKQEENREESGEKRRIGTREEDDNETKNLESAAGNRPLFKP